MILTWDFTFECHRRVTFTPLEYYCPVQWKKAGSIGHSSCYFCAAGLDIGYCFTPSWQLKLIVFFLLHAPMVFGIYTHIIEFLQYPIVCLESCTSAQNVSCDKYLLKGRSFDLKTLQPKLYILKFWNLKTQASSRVKTRNQCCVRI